jgi:hypothetical protein
MKSVRRKHLIICLVLGLLAIPVFFLDRALLGGGGGGNWITLDFRGLIFWAYITMVAVHVTLSSIAVLLFPKAGAWRIHLGSMFCFRDPSRHGCRRLRQSAPSGHVQRIPSVDGESQISHERDRTQGVVVCPRGESSDGDPREPGYPSTGPICRERNWRTNGFVRLLDNQAENRPSAPPADE